MVYYGFEQPPFVRVTLNIVSNSIVPIEFASVATAAYLSTQYSTGTQMPWKHELWV
ncbi:hypothetical protein PILCRDRAFT_812720 [Piloderma croceum F 1598]|uniref:Uncharacterized protein n=1 Tax=Piloderma croceum (strain F 1598) TaxID=765440 RepID=A0A0C3GH36_PILCF|nr:hypothetical protein PILCRDRAFT_812720 [Piloderma croceum F 1598]